MGALFQQQLSGGGALFRPQVAIQGVLFRQQLCGAGALFRQQFYAQADGVATVAGVGASARVASISAHGVIGSLSLLVTNAMVHKVVRDYIKSIVPTQRVLRTPVNRATMPNAPYVTFAPGARRPLATNVSFDVSGGRIVKREEQMTFQIDCYGEGSSDVAETLNVLYRDPYACELFEESGVDVAPLFAGDVMQAPFTNDANQYEERYTFTIDLQINSRVAVLQDSCNILDINPVSVDANFPPTEE